MTTSGEKHPGTTGGATGERNLGQSGTEGAKTGGKGSVTDRVSNDMSDAEEAPEDTMPKDNSHNFT